MNKPEKFKSYTQIDHTKAMRDHDSMIDWMNALETKIGEMESEVFEMRKKCDACVPEKKAASSK